MRYEVKEENTDGLQQWVIWDNLYSEVFARFGTEKEATDIIDKWKAAQLAAEASGE
ncbi:hypothetical protein HWB76_gp085 [Streptomyces phage Blueeyedbeauty]|uniref:Uncharacterized protein n=1 Tax=Streptomyces phage Blueeyedbeauty TaxID=2250336 RepID=A0A345L286_9CAUD|nr:hypothetical protein HWB76_gp085 [Streptomyces phage Blueeyedbeauty]AXH49388.1 hypothetical protein SEA_BLUEEYEDBEAUTY_208 [Streptomyces phage Blueeyedbeauty]